MLTFTIFKTNLESKLYMDTLKQDEICIENVINISEIDIRIKEK